MPSIKSETITITLAAWNQYQQLVRNSADAVWKIRAAFYAVSSALLASGYASQTNFIYLTVPLAAILFLLLEGGHLRLQMQYIKKSLEIERTITDLLVDEKDPFLPMEGISTAISTPTLLEMFALFSPKRYLFWLPYLMIIATAMLLGIYDVHAAAA
ncbi:MAG TPA: hypothetical protein PLC86_11420 [Candidatus Accumulibacter phosphatis]|nr:hypothetical protein [Candidatus Accumulibacter phosphatis]